MNSSYATPTLRRCAQELEYAPDIRSAKAIAIPSVPHGTWPPCSNLPGILRCFWPNYARINYSRVSIRPNEFFLNLICTCGNYYRARSAPVTSPSTVPTQSSEWTLRQDWRGRRVATCRARTRRTVGNCFRPTEPPSAVLAFPANAFLEAFVPFLHRQAHRIWLASPLMESSRQHFPETRLSTQSRNVRFFAR